MRRKMYFRNVEAIYTLNSILLNPLIEYKAYSGKWLYASRSGGGGIHSAFPFGLPVTRDFWIVLKENSLLFEGQSSMMYAFTAMFGDDETDEDNFNFYIDCDEDDVMVRLI